MEVPRLSRALGVRGRVIRPFAPTWRPMLPYVVLGNWYMLSKGSVKRHAEHLPSVDQTFTVIGVSRPESRSIRAGRVILCPKKYMCPELMALIPRGLELLARGP